MRYEKKMAKHVCKAANRALGLVIAIYKVFGGFNFESYSKRYDTIVWNVVSYGAAVWSPVSIPHSSVQQDTTWELANIHPILQSKEIQDGNKQSYASGLQCRTSGNV